MTSLNRWDIYEDASEHFHSGHVVARLNARSEGVVWSDSTDRLDMLMLIEMRGNTHCIADTSVGTNQGPFVYLVCSLEVLNIEVLASELDHKAMQDVVC